MRQALATLLVLAVAAVAQLAWAAGTLPERVPTHFDAAGRPDAWASRETALAWQAVLLVALPGFLLGLAAILPKMPISLLNVPHKEHWFAPERRAASWRYLRTWMVWMADLCLAFLLILFHDICRASLAGPEGHLGGLFWVGMGLFLAGTLAMVVGLYRRFGRPPAADGGASSGP